MEHEDNVKFQLGQFRSRWCCAWCPWWCCWRLCSASRAWRCGDGVKRWRRWRNRQILVSTSSATCWTSSCLQFHIRHFSVRHSRIHFGSLGLGCLNETLRLLTVDWVTVGNRKQRSLCKYISWTYNSKLSLAIGSIRRKNAEVSRNSTFGEIPPGNIPFQYINYIFYDFFTKISN